MQSIDDIVINFKPEQLFFLNICLGFLMFGVALDLSLRHFRDLFRAPRKPLIGLFSQWILMPSLTLVLVFLLRPAPSVALGMILLACCPGGNVSNYAVHLAKANSALSVLMTSVSTLGAIAVTPLAFTYLSQLIPGTESLRASIQVEPANMIRTILLLIIFPLALGMGMRHYFPRLTAKIQAPVKYLSMAIFLSFVVFAILGNLDNIYRYLHLVFLLVVLHNGLALTMGYFFAKATGLNQADRRAIAIETGIQNSGLGLILIFNFFNGLGGMALIAAFWGIWHLISAFGLAMYWRSTPSAKVMGA
ncbi:MAG TPA: bile acid:sodium symporter family protein [Saprospiraceae bacterium]|nr:bile acid:sodium symporter family protein [Saprospiraceae bacterium]